MGVFSALDLHADQTGHAFRRRPHPARCRRLRRLRASAWDHLSWRPTEAVSRTGCHGEPRGGTTEADGQRRPSGRHTSRYAAGHHRGTTAAVATTPSAALTHRRPEVLLRVEMTSCGMPWGRRDRAGAGVGAAAEAFVVVLRDHRHHPGPTARAGLRQFAQWVTLAPMKSIAGRSGRRRGAAPDALGRTEGAVGLLLPARRGVGLGAEPVLTEMKPPAWMIRSKALRSTTRSLMIGKRSARHGSTVIVSPSCLKERMCRLAGRRLLRPCAWPEIIRPHIPQMPCDGSRCRRRSAPHPWR